MGRVESFGKTSTPVFLLVDLRCIVDLSPFKLLDVKELPRSHLRIETEAVLVG